MDAHLLVNLRRKALGISQAVLAERSRLSREMISRFESGSEIGLSAFRRMLQALELRIEIVPSAGNEAMVSDWHQFRARLDAELFARTRAARSGRANLREARLIDGTDIRVIDWGKIPA